MNILVINAGSSSVKYQLIDMANESVQAKGIVERIGIEGSMLIHKAKGQVYEYVSPSIITDHTQAMKLILDTLTHGEHGIIDDLSSILAIGHRIVHGGESFQSSVVIDDAVIQAIKDNIPLAPLHNPANLMGIEACRAVLPSTPMVGVFDTAFHQTMPPHSFLYGIPYEYYTKSRVRRYGFHGTSHQFVSRRAAELLGKPIEQTKIITCHLGNGCSIAAVDGGKSIDTSMGLTPLEGVMMGTRSGDLDPAIVEYLCKSEGMDVSQAVNVLNKKSGIEGMSGVSSDMRDVVKAAAEGNVQAENTIKAFTYRVRKYIGAYAVAMGGVDAIVMTAGIGENMKMIRERLIQGMEFFGCKLDVARNDATERGCEGEISTADSKVKVYVIPTDEELAIARDTLRLVKG